MLVARNDEPLGMLAIADEISGVADFMWMSAKVLRRIKLNIFFSMIYNIIGLGLSVVGFMTPIVAVIFQEAGCVTVVISSTLLLWSKKKQAPSISHQKKKQCYD